MIYVSFTGICKVGVVVVHSAYCEVKCTNAILVYRVENEV